MTREEIDNKITSIMNEYVLKHNKYINLKVATVLKRVKKMSSKQAEKELDFLISELKALAAYDEMNEINKLIEKILNNDNDVTSEVVREKIHNLPEDRLIHFSNDNIFKIHEDYCKNVYKFVLYESAFNRFDLLENEEVKNIVGVSVKEDVDSLKDNIFIPTKLFNKIKDFNDKTPLNEYLNHELLQDLFVYRNEYLTGNYKDDIESKENKIKKVKGDIRTLNKKKIKAMSKLVMFTTIGVAVALAPMTAIMVPSYKLGKKGAKKNSSTKILIDTPNGVKETHSTFYEPEFSYLFEDVFRNTTRRYVTVFGDPIGEEVNERGEFEGKKVKVKVYDYTDSDISDEELKTITLDEDKLIYDSLDSVAFLERHNQNGENLYGIYTGEAHRDVSIVDFHGEDTCELAVALFMGMLLAVVVEPLTLLGFGEEGLIDKYIDKMKQILRDYNNSNVTKQKLVEELEKLINEVKVLKEKQEAYNKIQETKKELYNVDKELDNMKPARL